MARVVAHIDSNSDITDVLASASDACSLDRGTVRLILRQPDTP
jgi:hypothetical protein